MEVENAKNWVTGIPQTEDEIKLCSNEVIIMYVGNKDEYTRVINNLQTIVDYMSERLDDFKKKTVGNI